MSSMRIDIAELSKKMAAACPGTFRSESINGYHLLGACIVAERLDLAERLVASGFPIDLVNPGYVTTALSEASHYQTVEHVRWLLEHGANPNGFYTEDCSPLHHAAARADLPIARALLDAGANPQVRDIAWCVPADVTSSDDMKGLLLEYPGQPHEYGSPIGTYNE